MTSPPHTPAARPASAPAPLSRQVLAQATMELRLLLRNGESLLVSFGIPLAVLVVLGPVLEVSLGPGAPLDSLVPVVLSLAVLSTAFTSQAIQTGFHRKYAVLKRLGATPLSRGAYLAAKVVAVAVVVVVQTAAILAVALAVGWAWPPGARIGLLAVGLLLGTATFTALALLLAGTLKAELTLALANAAYLALAGAGAVALREGGGFAARAAVATPSGALTLLLGEALPPPLEDAGLEVLAGMVLVGWLAGAAMAAARWFRWEP